MILPIDLKANALDVILDALVPLILVHVVDLKATILDLFLDLKAKIIDVLLDLHPIMLLEFI